MWLAKIQVLANHSSHADTANLILSVPKSIMNYRTMPETMTAIVELAAVTGVRPVEIVRVILSVPNAIWGYTTSFETRMWVAKLAVLSGLSPRDIEKMGYSFPRYVMRSAPTISQQRFIMSLVAVGQNRKAFELIDRPSQPEQEIGFWESLSRLRFFGGSD